MEKFENSMVSFSVKTIRLDDNDMKTTENDMKTCWCRQGLRQAEMLSNTKVTKEEVELSVSNIFLSVSKTQQTIVRSLSIVCRT